MARTQQSTNVWEQFDKIHNNIAVSLNINRVPEDLIGGIHHRNDQVRTGQKSHHSRNHHNPMNVSLMSLMMQSVADQGLSCPNLNN